MILDLAIARTIHVLGVVLWIGGVALIATVLLPVVCRLKTPQEKIAFFEQIENRFAKQARVVTVVTGLSGLYLVYAMQAWGRFAFLQYWWMHAMVFIWLIYTVLLFLLEPLILHRWFLKRAAARPDETFTLVLRLHWILIALSLLTVAGAVAGAHGLLLFNN